MSETLFGDVEPNLTKWTERMMLDLLHDRYANRGGNGPRCTHLPDGWAKSLDHWLGAGLPQSVMEDCLEIALGNRRVQDHAVFAYMGGIARKRIEKLHDDAKALLESEANDGS